jgi:hypothetical protein
MLTFGRTCGCRPGRFAMKSPEEQPSYRVYVLRSWKEGYSSSGTPAVWRFSLEDPTTRQRRGFADLESLMNFLVAETDESHFQYSSNDRENGRR